MLVNCAQQSALSGGEKDMTAPIVNEKTTFPKNESVKFIGDRIEIGFDEYINLKNSGKDVVITPFIKTKPTYEVKGKKIIIQFSEKLDENTTYSLNFGNSISDITEGNKIQNFSYVFSTGNVLDSLRVNGFVYNAFSKKQEEDVIVGLYKSFDDSTAFKEKPYYFSTSNKNGKFEIKNIKEGKYQLIALKDNNGNFKYDPFSDEIAFLDSTITVIYDTLNTPIILELFKEVKDKNWIASKSYRHPGRVNIGLEKNADTLELELLNNSFINGKKKQSFYNTDSIEFWIKEPQDIKTLQLTSNVGDRDTLKLNIKEKATDSLLRFKTNVSSGLPYYDSLTFTFKNPIKNIQKDLIQLIDEDSNSIDYTIKQENNLVRINASFEEDINYELHALPNAFKGLYGAINDSVHIFFSLIPSNKYGNLILNYEHQDSNQHIIYLMKEDKVLKEIMVNTKAKKIEFKNLEPGAYQLKAIVDTNKNKRWDAGSYAKKLFSEKVYLFEEKIELKAGWDLDLTWKNEK